MSPHQVLPRALGVLSGLKVVNGEGVYLGDIRDVTIDQTSGAVTEFEAHGGGMLGLGGTTVTVLAAAITAGYVVATEVTKAVFYRSAAR